MIESYFRRWARVLLSVRSLTPTISTSAPELSTARKKLRPMRPKPLIPTRMVTMSSSSAPVGAPNVVCSWSATRRADGGRGGGRNPSAVPTYTWTNGAAGTKVRPGAHNMAHLTPWGAVFSQVEHLGGEHGLGVRDPERVGALVRHREETPDPAGDGVLRQRRVGQRAELLEAGLLVLQAQPPRLEQVLGHVVAENLERSLDPGTGSDGCACGAAQVGVVEVGEAVRGAAHLAAGAALL